MVDNKTVLITGGTGSFGRKCTEIILNRYKPKKLIIFSRDELKQYEMAQVFSEKAYPCIRYFIGDVRDKERLHRAFHGVDYIIHAAALKQVPAAEYNPTEAIKTNIYGAENVINVAADRRVKKVIALSTDKAANPINLYGATKLCSDKLFIAGNSYVSGDECKFSVVRYGNVIGSRGSVIPFFLNKCKEGVLPITDMGMTRFWMTLERAVGFVLQCLEKMVGGELFIPKIPSMKIVDLAKAIDPECRLDVVGKRPGEKLNEVLVPRDDACNTIEFEDYFVIKSPFRGFKHRFNHDGGKPVAENFEYNSGTNPWLLSIDEMKRLIEDLNI